MSCLGFFAAMAVLLVFVRVFGLLVIKPHDVPIIDFVDTSLTEGPYREIWLTIGGVVLVIYSAYFLFYIVLNTFFTDKEITKKVNAFTASHNRIALRVLLGTFILLFVFLILLAFISKG